ncbi:MAG: histidine phosphatase family protein [Magnetospirillum sp.]|nr:MAG: histidine phosphatase family protein [Magnetospirillum sp.]
MTVFLVRHGQSTGNAGRVFSGMTDHPLTGLGRAQAAEAGRTLDGVGFAHVFTSELSRAVETADLLLAAAGVRFDRPRRLRGLNERDFGVFETANDPGVEHLPKDDLRRRVCLDIDYRPKDGESMRDCLERAVSCLEGEILPLAGDGHILVVAHGNVIRSLALVHLGWPPEMLPEMPSRNCLITRIEPAGWRKA